MNVLWSMVMAVVLSLLVASCGFGQATVEVKVRIGPPPPPVPTAAYRNAAVREHDAAPVVATLPATLPAAPTAPADVAEFVVVGPAGSRVFANGVLLAPNAAGRYNTPPLATDQLHTYEFRCEAGGVTQAKRVAFRRGQRVEVRFDAVAAAPAPGVAVQSVPTAGPPVMAGTILTTSATGAAPPSTSFTVGTVTGRTVTGVRGAGTYGGTEYAYSSGGCANGQCGAVTTTSFTGPFGGGFRRSKAR